MSEAVGAIRLAALFDYTAGDDDELSFHEGDVLVLRADEDLSGDWVWAQLGDQTGYAPRAYLAAEPEPEVDEDAEAGVDPADADDSAVRYAYASDDQPAPSSAADEDLPGADARASAHESVADERVRASMSSAGVGTPPPPAVAAPVALRRTGSSTAASSAPARRQRPRANKPDDVVIVQSAVRRWLAKRAMQRVPDAKRIVQHERKTWELYHTERRYVEGLQALVKCFYKPLQAYTQSDIGITAKEVEKIFKPILALLAVSEAFLSQVRMRCLYGPPPTVVSDIFCDFAPGLKRYARFINNYNFTLKTIERAMAHETFSTIVGTLGRNPLLKGQGLQSLLITPIQRPPRYELLMSDLRKCTPESHPDYAGILRAHEAATKANAFLNESKRDRENYDRVVELEQTQFSDPRKTIVPSKARRLVHEEQIPEAGSANPAASYFFLFNDQLVHTEMQRKDAYAVGCVFEAATSFYRFGSPLPDQPFRVTFWNSRSVVVMCCPNEQTRTAWLARLSSNGWRTTETIAAEYLTEGFMQKAGVINSKMQRRWFILHDAALHYYRSKKDTTSAGNIPLLQCSSVIAGPLMIHVNVNSGRTFFLKCDTERERDLWFNAICVCIVTAVDDSAALLTAAAASGAADAPARPHALSAAGDEPDVASRAAMSPAGRSRTMTTSSPAGTNASAILVRAGGMTQADELKRQLTLLSQQVASLREERSVLERAREQMSERVSQLEAEVAAAQRAQTAALLDADAERKRAVELEDERSALADQLAVLEARAKRDIVRLQDALEDRGVELARVGAELDAALAKSRGLEAELHARVAQEAAALTAPAVAASAVGAAGAAAGAAAGTPGSSASAGASAAAAAGAASTGAPAGAASLVSASANPLFRKRAQAFAVADERESTLASLRHDVAELRRDNAELTERVRAADAENAELRLRLEVMEQQRGARARSASPGATSGVTAAAVSAAAAALAADASASAASGAVAELQALREALDVERSQVAQLRADVERACTERDDALAQRSGAQSAQQHAAAEAERVRALLGAQGEWQARVAELSDEVERTRVERDDARAELRAAAQAQAHASSHLAAEADRVHGMLEVIDELRTRVSVLAGELEHERGASQQAHAVARSAEAERAAAHAQAERERAEQRRARAALEGELARAAAERDAARADAERARALFAEAETERDDAEQAARAASDNAAVLEEQLRRVQGELASVRENAQSHRHMYEQQSRETDAWKAEALGWQRRFDELSRSTTSAAATAGAGAGAGFSVRASLSDVRGVRDRSASGSVAGDEDEVVMRGELHVSLDRARAKYRGAKHALADARSQLDEARREAAAHAAALERDRHLFAAERARWQAERDALQRRVDDSEARLRAAVAAGGGAGARVEAGGERAAPWPAHAPTWSPAASMELALSASARGEPAAQAQALLTTASLSSAVPVASVLRDLCKAAGVAVPRGDEGLIDVAHASLSLLGERRSAMRATIEAQRLSLRVQEATIAQLAEQLRTLRESLSDPLAQLQNAARDVDEHVGHAEDSSARVQGALHVVAQGMLNVASALRSVTEVELPATASPSSAGSGQHARKQPVEVRAAPPVAPTTVRRAPTRAVPPLPSSTRGGARSPSRARADQQ